MLPSTRSSAEQSGPVSLTFHVRLSSLPFEREAEVEVELEVDVEAELDTEPEAARVVVLSSPQRLEPDTVVLTAVA